MKSKWCLVATWIYLCIEPGMHVSNSVNFYVKYLGCTYVIYKYYTLLYSEKMACQDYSFLNF